jgi:hypothetical protein
VTDVLIPTMNSARKIFLTLAAALLLTASVRAESVYWSDGFETNAPVNWTSTNGWHIAAPTAGPATNALGFRTHSGVRCATTQNYPNNQDTRLVCTNYGAADDGNGNLVVPDASQTPRLRFWHWFSFANALGYVEINNGSGWTNVTPDFGPTTYVTGGGVWSQPSIDLAPFAGQSIQIAFHFASGGCCGNALGWFIDDVSVVTNTLAVTNVENFETGAIGWSVDAGTWEIGRPTSGPNAAHSGTNCAGTILAGNYPNNVDSRLLTPYFTVPSSSRVALEFASWYNFNNALGFVEVRIGTNSWNTLSATNLNVSSGAWTNISLDITTYTGQTVQAAFHFISGGINTAPGWYVDDVSVVSAPALTVPSSRTITVGQTFSDLATATNSQRPNSQFVFALPAVSTNGFITANGIFSWTNTHPAVRTNSVAIKVTDDYLFSVTNSFSVVVWPAYVFSFTNTATAQTNFQLFLQSKTNTIWRIDASTNLVNWLPLYTGTVSIYGTLRISDAQVTNFPFRFYRAVYP